MRIAARDGVLLSANLWLPRAQFAGQQFPVVLEMIPYRKDDWRYEADHARMSYLAQRGFAGCRVDVRGTGSSAGVALDEYTAAETQDGCDVVAWLAAQPWCISLCATAAARAGCTPHGRSRLRTRGLCSRGGPQKKLR